MVNVEEREMERGEVFGGRKNLVGTGGGRTPFMGSREREVEMLSDVKTVSRETTNGERERESLATSCLRIVRSDVLLGQYVCIL